MALEDPSSIDLWLVDGFNVMHACVLKGRDRQRWWAAESQLRVARWLDAFAEGHAVRLVFDAKAPRSERCASSGLHASLEFAAHADDAIVEAVRGEAAERRICVVTGDRPLRDRSAAAGAEVLRPWSFAELVAAAHRGA